MSIAVVDIDFRCCSYLAQVLGTLLAVCVTIFQFNIIHSNERYASFEALASYFLFLTFLQNSRIPDKLLSCMCIYQNTTNFSSLSSILQLTNTIELPLEFHVLQHCT